MSIAECSALCTSAQSTIICLFRMTSTEQIRFYETGKRKRFRRLDAAKAGDGNGLHSRIMPIVHGEHGTCPLTNEGGSCFPFDTPSASSMRRAHDQFSLSHPKHVQ